MPRRNRVTPWNAIIATDARGTLMGNRGQLHDDDGNLRRRWTTLAWIACLLEFKGRKRQLMAPGLYTELFFLDEAVAFAAGHRPCFECRRPDAVRFRDTWIAANPGSGVRPGDRITALDLVLHAERVAADGTKPVTRTYLNTLPDGVFVALDDVPGEAWLNWLGQLHRYTPAGYVDARPRMRGVQVELLTPPSVVAAIAAGYVPSVHFSAESGGDELLDLTAL
ncbi:MAG TPA: hypothetical protein VFK32_01000 [Tepidiformaceae bacterium]|nr:hypothetical protein [Tepidiformaceae bacterium]